MLKAGQDQLFLQKSDYNRMGLRTPYGALALLADFKEEKQY